ncbi:hypothetical protein Ga0100231_000970 [Opitutaceae bacterium TAV4]|uniref:hypothetical protein n=1 Tax=Geminisphaera colitermitum TaxID=1148786 RepID=UPI0001965085|nr:hypothetical protein [Geminisphaera colitermitum]RRJ98959.1 hypothetical protein Ga0100230_011785 [Opitutaceae bacterium TAV3]RRK01414.1 hypothetical protein Ga0100231_000970 [Opitutaceae bacterium TAV4]
MLPPPRLTREILDEDLQIIRATLVVLHDDLHRLSSDAGDAVKRALASIDEARSAVTCSQTADIANG